MNCPCILAYSASINNHSSVGLLIITQYHGASHLAQLQQQKESQTFANHSLIAISVTVWEKVNTVSAISTDRFSSPLYW